jgi:hypothetical protein
MAATPGRTNCVRAAQPYIKALDARGIPAPIQMSKPTKPGKERMVKLTIDTVHVKNGSQVPIRLEISGMEDEDSEVQVWAGVGAKVGSLYKINGPDELLAMIDHA